MLTSLSAGILLVVSIGLVIGLIVLLVLQIITNARVQRLTYPLYEYAQSQAQAEVEKILAEAKAQAQKMLAEARANASALVEKERADIEAHSSDYKKALETLAQSAERSLSEQAEKARADGISMMQMHTKDIAAQSAEVQEGMKRLLGGIEQLSQSTVAQAQEMRRALETQSKQASGDLAHAFEEIAAQGRKRIDEQIDAFAKQADAEVAAYRESRKKIVDMHMTELVVEATKLVLQKSLTREEHAQLVQRALQEARSAGIL